MNRKLLQAVAPALAVMTVVAVGACWSRAELSGASQTDVASTQSLPQRVSALGRLEPSSTVLTIAAPSGSESSVVESLAVVEGQNVRRGETLATFDTAARREAALAEAVAQVASAEAELAQVEAGAKAGDVAAQEAQVALLTREVRHAEIERERAATLVARDAGTTEELEQKEWELDRARLDQSRARSLLEAVAEVRLVDVAAAKAKVTVAQAAVKRAEAELALSRVVAPVDGRVLRLRTRVGERVGDSGLLELGSVAEMHAVAEVFEGDLGRVRVGERAVATLESLGERLRGVVVEVGHVVARKAVLSNDPVSDTDARVVEVRVKLDPADSRRVERLSNARVEVLIGESVAVESTESETR
jgi:HlyD family secretion protein